MQEVKSFLFQGYSKHDCELIALQRIPAELRVIESELLHKKWFDYRQWHPVQATQLYAETYAATVRRHYAQTKDIEGAEDLQVLDHPDIFQSRHMTSAWKARQGADIVGVKYSFAIDFIMKRAFERHWKVFPQLNQCYGSELLLDMRDAWEVHCAASLQLAVDPIATKQDVFGSDDYRAWIIRQIRNRQHPEFSLSQVMQKGHLPEILAGQEFDQATFRKAKALIENISHP